MLDKYDITNGFEFYNKIVCAFYFSNFYVRFYDFDKSIIKFADFYIIIFWKSIFLKNAESKNDK